jgi:hypothetical protein
MRKIIFAIIISLLLFITPSLFAKDVYVKGYTRKDGTYVQPHVRSSPDSSKSNNYGPSKNDSELMNPKTRDNDKDGTPNYIDKDDDNDGVSDETDKKQYTPGE